MSLRMRRMKPKRIRGQAPPTPKAVKANPTDNVALPLGSIKNFQHFHNAPLSNFTPVASPSPKKNRKKVPSSSLPSFPSEKARTKSNSPLPTSPKNAVECAKIQGAMANERLKKKQEKLSNFQKRLQARVSQRVRKEKENAAKARLGWVQLEKKAEKTARRAATGVESASRVTRAKPTDRSTWKKNPKVSLDDHIVNVTTQAQSARMALFAHSRAGKRAMQQAAVPQAMPTFTMNNPAAVRAGSSGVESPVGKQSKDGEPDSTVGPDGIDMIEVAKDTVPAVGGGWVPKLAYLPAEANGGGFEPHNIHRASASNLVAKVRKAEMDSQRERARRNMEEKKAKQRRAKKEVEIEAQRVAHEERMSVQRSVNEQERDERRELEKSHAESADATRKSQLLQAKRQRDTTSRYITALRKRLLFQLKEKNMEVPPLCSCADSSGSLESGKPMWDSCANNCQFRNNPKDVKRIVQDLVRSVKYSLA